MKTLLLSCLFILHNVAAQENPAPKPAEDSQPDKKEQKQKHKDKDRGDKPESQRVREAMQRIMNSDQLKAAREQAMQATRHARAS